MIGDVRGHGLMMGVEVVKDRGTKEPGAEIAARITEGAKERNLIVGRGGTHGNVLRINPPMCYRGEGYCVYRGSVALRVAGGEGVRSPER